MYKKNHILIITRGEYKGEDVKVLEAEKLKTKVEFLDREREPKWFLNNHLQSFLSDIFSI